MKKTYFTDTHNEPSATKTWNILQSQFILENEEEMGAVERTNSSARLCDFCQCFLRNDFTPLCSSFSVSTAEKSAFSLLEVVLGGWFSPYTWILKILFFFFPGSLFQPILMFPSECCVLTGITLHQCAIQYGFSYTGFLSVWSMHMGLSGVTVYLEGNRLSSLVV